MAWIQSHQKMRHDGRLKLLGEMLGVDRKVAFWHLSCLEWWCLDESPDGDLSKFHPAQIATAADYDGPENVLEALKNSFFADAQGKLVDWAARTEALFTAREKSRKRSKDFRDRQRGQLDLPYPKAEVPPSDHRHTAAPKPQEAARPPLDTATPPNENRKEGPVLIDPPDCLPPNVTRDSRQKSREEKITTVVNGGTAGFSQRDLTATEAVEWRACRCVLRRLQWDENEIRAVIDWAKQRFGNFPEEPDRVEVIAHCLNATEMRKSNRPAYVWKCKESPKPKYSTQATNALRHADDYLAGQAEKARQEAQDFKRLGDLVNLVGGLPGGARTSAPVQPASLATQ